MIGVDEKEIEKQGLKPNEAFLLWNLNNHGDTTVANMANVDFLIKKEFVSSDLKITDRGEKFVKRTFFDIEKRPVIPPGAAAIKELAEKYRELFPKKDNFGKPLKSGGYPVRGNLNNIIRKMRMFKQEHPQYSDELILSATKKYVEDKKRENYAYMKIADYLILKDRNSVLASLCDAFEETEADGPKQNWGHSV